MNVKVAQIAQKLSMPEDQLILEGIRAVLRDQVALLEAERRVRCAKRGCASSSSSPASTCPQKRV
jgi:hypothetical protein